MLAKRNQNRAGEKSSKKETAKKKKRQHLNYTAKENHWGVDGDEEKKHTQ